MSSVAGATANLDCPENFVSDLGVTCLKPPSLKRAELSSLNCPANCTTTNPEVDRRSQCLINVYQSFADLFQVDLEALPQLNCTTDLFDILFDFDPSALLDVPSAFIAGLQDCFGADIPFLPYVGIQA